MLGVHQELLRDVVRTNAYRDAIRHFVNSDSVVLDIGTGSGILSFFACEAGAGRVFAVEAQHTADVATFLAKHLGYSDRMEVIHDRSTNIELPERATLLVTETLGPFGFDEHILSTVIDARARLIRPDADIIPQRIELSVVPVEAPAVFEQHVGWWKQRQFGFDLSPLAVFASNVIYVANVGSESFLAPPATVIAADLATVSSSEVCGRAHFTAARWTSLRILRLVPRHAGSRRRAFERDCRCDRLEPCLSAAGDAARDRGGDFDRHRSGMRRRTIVAMERNDRLRAVRSTDAVIRASVL